MVFSAVSTCTRGDISILVKLLHFDKKASPMYVVLDRGDKSIDWRLRHSYIKWEWTHLTFLNPDRLTVIKSLHPLRNELWMIVT